jgi:hypothetical protein
MTRRCRTYLLAALAALGLVVASPAHASACGDAVINDWSDNGQIDNTYKPQCYRDALHQLPEDMQSYSSAPEDIARALQQALASGGDPGSGNKPGGSAKVGSGTPGDKSSGPGKSNGPTVTAMEGKNGVTIDPSDTTPSSGVFKDAIGELGPSNARSIPVPVLMLGGIALLLLTAAASGVVARRLRVRGRQPRHPAHR